MKVQTIDACFHCGMYFVASGMCDKLGRSVANWKIDDECPLPDASEPRTCETCGTCEYGKDERRNCNRVLTGNASDFPCFAYKPASPRSVSAEDVETVRDALEFYTDARGDEGDEIGWKAKAALAALGRIAGKEESR